MSEILISIIIAYEFRVTKEAKVTSVMMVHKALRV
jgi:hypothetical protein